MAKSSFSYRRLAQEDHRRIFSEARSQLMSFLNAFHFQGFQASHTSSVESSWKYGKKWGTSEASQKTLPVSSPLVSASLPHFQKPKTHNKKNKARKSQGNVWPHILLVFDFCFAFLFLSYFVCLLLFCFSSSWTHPTPQLSFAVSRLIFETCFLCSDLSMISLQLCLCVYTCMCWSMCDVFGKLLIMIKNSGWFEEEAFFKELGFVDLLDRRGCSTSKRRRFILFFRTDCSLRRKRRRRRRGFTLNA